MKRLFAFACVLAILMTMMLPMNLFAAEPLLKTNKTSYTEGEPILVQATGSGSDWVGIYLKTDTVKDDLSIRWYYVADDGNKSGDTKNLFESEYTNRPDLADLPAGEYTVYLFANGGYQILSKVDITVIGSEAPSTGSESSERTIKTDKTSYTEGEPILTTATGSGSDWVGLYLTTDTVKDDQAIRWYYVAKDGNKSGSEKNLRTAEGTNSSRAAYADVPAGDYVIYLFEGDKWNYVEQIRITVLPDTTVAAAPTAPASVVYNRTATAVGLADGTLTIKAGEGALPERYVAYWGNADGVLADYTAFAPIECKGETTDYTMVANTLIPTDADRIYVYAAGKKAVSAQAATVLLPEGCNSYVLGNAAYELQILSDIHLNSSLTHLHNKHFTMALEDIKKLSPNSIGIFVNGDIADHGEVSEYRIFNQQIKNAGDGLPKVYCAIGNHDLAQGPYNTKLSNFLKYTEPGVDRVYYDLWLEDTHFIFLGSETPGLNADLSAKQLSWFKAKLAEKHEEGRPIYVFLHQGLMDTVAGTFAYQKWHGINQATRFANILKDYPEVVLFSGHSHWEMDSLSTMKARDDKLPTIFNTASSAYLWNDASMETDVGVEGSQGYYLYAYKDKLVLRGRDFVNGKWIASAQYVVDYPEGNVVGTDDPAKPDDPTTGEPPVTTAPTTPEQKAPGDESGAGKLVLPIAIGAGAVVGVAAVTTVAVLKGKSKKKK